MGQVRITTVCIAGDMAFEEVQSMYSPACGALADRGIEITDGGTISDVSRARQTADSLPGGRPGILLIIVLSGRSAPMIEALGKSAVPLVIWAIGKNYAFPSSALAAGALRETGRIVKLVHGGPENEKIVSEILDTLNVMHAMARLRSSKMGLIGGLFFNLVSCRYDSTCIRDKFGMDLQTVSYGQLQDLMKSEAIMDSDTLRQLMSLCGTFDLRVPQKSLVPGLKLHMALRYLARCESFDAFAVECWTGLPQVLGLNPCLGFIEDSYVMACEGDVVMGIMLLAMRHMIGRVPFTGDIQYLDEGNEMIVRHCGAPAALADHGDVVLDWSPLAEKQGFGTVTCRPKLNDGFATMVRLYGKKCEHMHIACGDILSCNRDDSCAVSIKLCGNRAEFIDACGGNHYVVASGDIRNKLYLFGELLRINIQET